MAASKETEAENAVDEPGADSDQASRLKRYDQRMEEWLTSLKEGAEQRSPEVLSALATRAKDVAAYLDNLAEKARSRNEASGEEAHVAQRFEEVTAGGEKSQGALGYRGPDPESDPKGDGDDEDQGT